MVYGELKDFGLFQFGGSLLLVSTGHQPLQLAQRQIDAISALLLDDTAPLLAAHHVATVRLAGASSRGRNRKGEGN